MTLWAADEGDRASLAWEDAVERHGLVHCDCSDPAEGFLGCDECPGCDALGCDAVHCRTCDAPWCLQDGEKECPECVASGRVGRDVVRAINRALAEGRAVHIEPIERSDGSRSGPCPARAVWVGGVAIVYGAGTGQGWPEALRMAAKTRAD